MKSASERLIAIAALLSFLPGCGIFDPVIRKVNSPKSFRAVYSISESTQISGEAIRQRIELIAKQNKFYVNVYKYGRIVRTAVYDGKTLWQHNRKQGMAGKEIVFYKKASLNPNDTGIYFWRMPGLKGLDGPVEKDLYGEEYYIYTWRSPGPSGHLEGNVRIDRNKFVIKRIHTKFFLKDDPSGPFAEWKLDCTEIKFVDEIPDSTFRFTAPPGIEVMSFDEAVRKGMAVFTDIVEGIKKN